MLPFGPALRPPGPGNTARQLLASAVQRRARALLLQVALCSGPLPDWLPAGCSSMILTGSPKAAADSASSFSPTAAHVLRMAAAATCGGAPPQQQVAALPLPAAASSAAAAAGAGEQRCCQLLLDPAVCAIRTTPQPGSDSCGGCAPPYELPHTPDHPDRLPQPQRQAWVAADQRQQLLQELLAAPADLVMQVAVYRKSQDGAGKATAAAAAQQPRVYTMPAYWCPPEAAAVVGLAQAPPPAPWAGRSKRIGTTGETLEPAGRPDEAAAPAGASSGL
jgi:hypothetical protein